jgi:hypothetical protein
MKKSFGNLFGLLFWGTVTLVLILVLFELVSTENQPAASATHAETRSVKIGEQAVLNSVCLAGITPEALDQGHKSYAAHDMEGLGELGVVGLIESIPWRAHVLKVDGSWTISQVRYNHQLWWVPTECLSPLGSAYDLGNPPDETDAKPVHHNKPKADKPIHHWKTENFPKAEEAEKPSVEEVEELAPVIETNPN